jgi:HD-like signal output (HDOD) protein
VIPEKTKVVDPIQAILGEGVKLPSFPDVLLKLDSELRSDDIDLNRVARLVGMDPVLSGQILRMANSAWYSRGGSPVQELSKALIRLGLPATQELVHALVLPSLFPRKGSSLDLPMFWRHSFAVALFAQGIGRKLKLDRSGLETLWTAGLLHDIGALLFDLVASETYRRLMGIGNMGAVQDGEEPLSIDITELEREWLGTDHAALGAVFLEKFWKLPKEIVWCVRCHEDLGWALDEPEAVKTILPIHVADMLCEERGVTWVPKRARGHSHLGKAWDRMGLTEADVDDLAEDVERAMEQSEAMLQAGA